MNTYKIGTVSASRSRLWRFRVDFCMRKKARNSTAWRSRNTANTKDPGGPLGQGVESAKNKDYEKAIEEFTKAIEAEPHDAKNYFNRATAYRGLNKLSGSVRGFSKAIELAPQEARGYVGRGEVLLLQQKQLDQALADFDKALEISPNDRQRPAFSRFLYISKSEWEKAIDDYTVVVQKVPDDGARGNGARLPTAT